MENLLQNLDKNTNVLKLNIFIKSPILIFNNSLILQVGNLIVKSDNL